MVGRGGIEPPTFALSAQRSNRLSYFPMVPRTGLEPVIFRVKGVCLNHLD